MSVKNFKNPWAEGGEFHPDWLGGEKALENNVINLQEDSTDSANSSNDEYDTIDVIISKSSIQGVDRMKFIRTHKASKKPKRLYVRYLDINGEVLWTGDNFKPGTIEFEHFNRETSWYDPMATKVKGLIVLDGPFKTPIVQEKFWIAWDRYYSLGEPKTEKEVGDQFGPHAMSWRVFLRKSHEPSSLFSFTAYFENHSVTKITNQQEVNRIIQEIYKTFENGGGMNMDNIGAQLTARKVGFVVVGYHSPEPTNNTGLNNTKLAIGRAKTVQNLLISKLSGIEITSIAATSGGDSLELGVRPAITYFGMKEFIDRLGIPYTPPTIGE